MQPALPFTRSTPSSHAFTPGRLPSEQGLTFQALRFLPPP